MGEKRLNQRETFADITTVGDPREWFEGFPITSSPDYVVYFNDFTVAQDFAAADWVITTTEAGGGDASEALAGNEINGALLITNDANDNDLDSLQHTEDTWKLEVGKQLWYETRCKVSDGDTCDLLMGLAITDSTPLDTADRIGFEVLGDTSAGNIKVLAEKNSLETNSDTQKDLADNTYVRLGFHFDGANTVTYYVDRIKTNTITTNIPDDVNLTITMHYQNADAIADTLTVDYLYVAKER